MTHRDGFPRFSARSVWRGDAGHREPCAPSESYGPSAPWPKALGYRRSGRADEPAAGEPPEGVGKPCRCPAGPAAFLLPARWARPLARPLARRIACPISMGHYGDVPISVEIRGAGIAG